MLPDPPAAECERCVGEITYGHSPPGKPSCVTVNALPPANILPVRGMPVSFGLTLKLTVPVPVLLLAEVTSTHVAWLTASQLQVLAVVMVKLPTPPASENNSLVFDMVSVQAGGGVVLAIR
jgi:hypothetical protein